MRRLSDVLARLAESDGDPEVCNVVVCYELKSGDIAALYSIATGQKAFMEAVMEVAAHAANAPGTMN